MKFKSLALKLTAAAMTALLAFQHPVYALAASKPIYISDLLISYAKSESAEDIAEAKQWLTAKGYTVLDQNLNQGSDSTLSKARPVFLGYKMTSDPDDAVTDIRLMNMNGDFSYDDYTELVVSQRDEINDFIHRAKDALKAYRENFAYVQDILRDYGKSYAEIAEVMQAHPDDFDAGCYRAMITYESLNQYYDDDTGYLLGDLLLDEVQEEFADYVQHEDGTWEFDEGKHPGLHANLTTILMQGNTAAVAAVMQAFAYSADTDYETTWLDRALDSRGLQGILDRYGEEYPALPASKLQSLVKADYDSDSGLLAVGADLTKKAAKVYAESGLTLQSDSDEIDAYFKKKENKDKSSADWSNGGILTEGLRGKRMAGVSLSDLLLGDGYDFNKAEDRAELYPLLDAMTQAQRSLLEYIPLSKMLIIGLTKGDDAWKTAYLNTNETYAGLKPVSVYACVNRSMFDTNGGTALTRTALDHQTANNEVFTGQPGWSARYSAMVILSCASAATMSVGVGFLIAGKLKSSSFMEKQLNSLANNVSRGYESIVEPTAAEQLLIDAEKNIDYADDMMASLQNPEIEYFQAKPLSQIGKARVTNLFSAIGIAVCIAAAVMMIISGVLYLIEMSSLDVEYKSIPKYMVHGRELRAEKDWETGTKWQYIYYSAVKCNRYDGGFASRNTKEMSECGDLNGDVGKEWVAVYTTKDKNAGNPVTAKSLNVSTSSKIPVGGHALTYFGEEYAANLNNPNYVHNSAAPEFYIYFKHDTAYSGSVTGIGTTAAVGALAALAGGVICFFVASNSGKKRREEATA